MRVLAVSAAKFGIQSVVCGVLSPLSEYGIDCTHLTLPILETPNCSERRTLLSETALNTVEDVTPAYLAYGIWNFWRKAYQYMEQVADKYDIIWMHSPVLIPLLPNHVADKTVITYHNRFFSTRAPNHSSLGRLYYEVQHQIEKRGILNTEPAAITVVNDEIINDITELNFPYERIFSVENGVDIDRFTPENTPATLTSRPELANRTILLSLGTLTEQKRPLTLLKTYKQLQKNSNCDLILVLAGDGALRSDIEQYIHKYHLDNIVVLGYVEEEIKPNLYTMADYFIFSSEYDPGGPLTMYEALASGVPVISPDFPHCRFLDEKNCGTRVTFDSVNTAAEQICSYLESDPKTHSKNARQYAIKNRSWDVQAKGYLDVFQDVLKK